MRRPVPAPPAWTTRRREWPPLERERQAAVRVPVELDATALELLHHAWRLEGQQLRGRAPA